MFTNHLTCLQMSRLLYGAAYEHVEDLASIQVLKKVGVTVGSSTVCVRVVRMHARVHACMCVCVRACVRAAQPSPLMAMTHPSPLMAVTQL